MAPRGAPTHRYLTTLVALGYMEQDKSRKYRLSLRVTDLGMSVLNSIGLREHAHSVLEELRRESKFTASLAVLDGLEIVCVDRVVSFQRGQDEIDIGLGIGSRLPAYCTAMGKVLLAYLPKDERQNLLSQASLECRGPNAITGKGALLAELEAVLEEGFATEDQELAIDRVAIAAPIRDESKAVVAAIDLSAHAATITIEQLADGLRSHLIAAAGRRLRASGPPPRGRGRHAWMTPNQRAESVAPDKSDLGEAIRELRCAPGLTGWDHRRGHRWGKRRENRIFIANDTVPAQEATRSKQGGPSRTDCFYAGRRYAPAVAHVTLRHPSQSRGCSGVRLDLVGLRFVDDEQDRKWSSQVA